MIEASSHQEYLEDISNGLVRWHQHGGDRDEGARRWYTQDLIVASEDLEDFIDRRLGEQEFVRLALGEAAAIGTRISGAPMQTLNINSIQAVPHSHIALDHVTELHSVEAGRRYYERHFGNLAIYFSARQLADALAEGAKLTIEGIDDKPADWWSFERPAPLLA